MKTKLNWHKKIFILTILAFFTIVAAGPAQAKAPYINTESLSPNPALPNSQVTISMFVINGDGQKVLTEETLDISADPAHGTFGDISFDSGGGKYSILYNTSSAEETITITAISTGPDYARATGSAILTVATPPPPPAAPIGLTATAVSSSQIDLSWTDNSDENGYNVYRKNSKGDFDKVGGAEANTTQYSDKNLSAETNYIYKIKAYNAGGESDFSNEANDTTLAGGAPPSPPAAPSGLTATAVSSSQIDLSWTDNSDNEDGFYVYRQNAEGYAFFLVGSTGANTTQYSDKNLSAETNYVYKVLADNTGTGGGSSGFTDEASATTQQAPPVAKFSYTFMGGTTIDFDASDSYDPGGGSITNYAWEFGDKVTSEGPDATVSHTYSATGSYAVILTVINDEEIVGSTDKTIYVGPTGTLAGTVTRSDDGKPIPSVNMAIAGIAQYPNATDQEGKYSIPGVPIGTYTVTFSCGDYTTVEQSGVVIEANQTTTLDVTLTPSGAVPPTKPPVEPPAQTTYSASFSPSRISWGKPMKFELVIKTTEKPKDEDEKKNDQPEK